MRLISWFRARSINYALAIFAHVLTTWRDIAAMCRQFTPLDGIKRNNFVINQLLDVVSKHAPGDVSQEPARSESTAPARGVDSEATARDVCSRCCQVAATCHCQQCDKDLCDKCREKHDKTHEGHDVIAIDNARQSPSSLQKMCPTHTDNELNIFCHACSDVICFYCAVDDSHDGHRRQLLAVGDSPGDELLPAIGT